MERLGVLNKVCSMVVDDPEGSAGFREVLTGDADPGECTVRPVNRLWSPSERFLDPSRASRAAMARSKSGSWIGDAG